jgi:hypothetical protein
MKAIKGVYQDGAISLLEEAPDRGPVEVLIVFPQAEPDPWEKILSEATPRASFAEFAAKVKQEIAEGKAQPLDLSQL